MDSPTPKAAGSEKSSSALDLDSVSEQMQQVRAAASALLDKAKDASSVSDMASAVEKAAGALKLVAELSKTRTELVKVNEEISSVYDDNAVLQITAQIGGVLKTPRLPGARIDLSSTYFYDGDWKGIDYQGANLDGIWWPAMDPKNVEPKGVAQFNGAYSMKLLGGK